MAQCLTCGSNTLGDVCSRCYQFLEEHQRIVAEMERLEEEAQEQQSLERLRRQQDYEDFRDEMYWNGAWVV